MLNIGSTVMLRLSCYVFTAGWDKSHDWQHDWYATIVQTGRLFVMLHQNGWITLLVLCINVIVTIQRWICGCCCIWRVSMLQHSPAGWDSSQLATLKIDEYMFNTWWPRMRNIQYISEVPPFQLMREFKVFFFYIIARTNFLGHFLKTLRTVSTTAVYVG